ncbi:hypothetical protein SUDANB126_00168 [Streptomyces sp. enrichment culture]
MCRRAGAAVGAGRSRSPARTSRTSGVIVSWETMTPRSGIGSSASRKPSGKRWHSRTQREMISTGYRWPLYDGGADDPSEPLPGTTNSKTTPDRSANVTTPLSGPHINPRSQLAHTAFPRGA